MPMPSARACAGFSGVTGSPSQNISPVGLPRHAVDDLHQRRLAGAVLAEHRVDLARQHREVDAVVGDDRRVDLADAAQLEARRAGSGRAARLPVASSALPWSRIGVAACAARVMRGARRVAASAAARTAAHLQHLRRDRDGDHLGLLARDAGDADRAGHRGEARARHAARLEPPLELAPLRHASRSGRSTRNPSRARMRSASGSSSAMAVRHHQEIRAGRRRRDFGLGRVGGDAARRWPGSSAGKASSRVSTQVIRQASPAEHADDRAADVAGAEQHDRESRAGARRRRSTRSPRAPPSVASAAPARVAARAAVAGDRRGASSSCVASRRACRPAHRRRDDQPLAGGVAAQRRSTSAQSTPSARAARRARRASGVAARDTGSNSSCATPPQHWPRLAPSGKRCSARAPRAGEQVARDVDRLVFEVAAADRAVRSPPP